MAKADLYKLSNPRQSRTRFNPTVKRSDIKGPIQKFEKVEGRPLRVVHVHAHGTSATRKTVTVENTPGNNYLYATHVSLDEYVPTSSRESRNGYAAEYSHSVVRRITNVEFHGNLVRFHLEVPALPNGNGKLRE